MGWAILASPLIVTTPILNCSKTDQIRGKFTPGRCTPSLTALQKEILFNKEVIEINQDISPAGRLVSPHLTAVEPAGCTLSAQMSHAQCKLGVSFGCYTGNQSMWTAGGCRGRFECDGVANVECNHMGGHFAVCPCTKPKPSPALVYARNLTGGDIAVAFYNPSDVDGFGSIEFSSLGWAETTTAFTRNLWLQIDLGQSVGRFPANGTVTIGAHETMVLR